MTRVAGTLGVLETACCTRVVAELAQLGGVEAAGDRVEQCVEGGRVRDAAGGEGTNIFAAEIVEFDPQQL